MFLLRLMGMGMADDASETVSGGIRNYLGTLAFVIPMAGVEECVRRAAGGGPTLPYWLSVSLIIVGLPMSVMWAFGKKTRRFWRRFKAAATEAPTADKPAGQ